MQYPTWGENSFRKLVSKEDHGKNIVQKFYARIIFLLEPTFVEAQIDT